jgi:DNA-directed RNA polymerase subunit RPC12/RpoP
MNYKTVYPKQKERIFMITYDMTCPKCGATMKLNEKDERLRCPYCNHEIMVELEDTPEEIREKEYAKSYGYLDDERYVKAYIESKSRTKSRKQIEQELIFRKGVSKEAIERGFENAEVAEITEVIQKYMQKKKIDPQNCDYEQKQKFFAYMMRKGFQIEELKMVFGLT